MIILKLGSTGAAVTRLQKQLKRLRFDPGPVTGVFDTRTEAAVVDFQRKHLIGVDGEVGDETRRVIAAAIRNLEAALAALVPPGVAAFNDKLVKVALGQWTTFHTMNEADRELCGQIKKYWRATELAFPGCAVFWSAVFVSFCVKQAGATAEEFAFHSRHSHFVHAAIQNKLRNRGVFHGLRPESTPLRRGDILQVNRDGTKHDYDSASTDPAYGSHSAIVVKIDAGSAITVGGNEGDSIRKTRVVLTSRGFVKKRTTNPHISIVRRVA
jgi:hypothetical protein